MENKENIVHTRVMLPMELHSRLVMTRLYNRGKGKQQTLHELILELLENGLTSAEKKQKKNN